MARAIGPGGDVYFGFSRIGAKDFNTTAGTQSGFEAAAHLKLFPFVGAEADYAHYGLGGASSIPHTTVVMVGPRVTVGSGFLHVFVRGLAGWEHSGSADNTITAGALSFAMGGGADFRIAPHFAWRVNGDYMGAPQSSPSGATHARFGTGLVFRF
jgi:hypothetical protein